MVRLNKLNLNQWPRISPPKQLRSWE